MSKTMKQITDEMEQLPNRIPKGQSFEQQSIEIQSQLNREAEALINERTAIKKSLADIQDVKDSLGEISEVMDVDLAKAVITAKALFRNKITKWELYVATAEIIRSRHTFTTVSEYFHAITRIKIRMQGSSSNIFDDKALDF